MARPAAGLWPCVLATAALVALAALGATLMASAAAQPVYGMTVRNAAMLAKYYGARATGRIPLCWPVHA